ncbi:MAG: hypothetical protein V8S33_14040 [Intestinibacter bartlettii]
MFCYNKIKVLVIQITKYIIKSSSTTTENRFFSVTVPKSWGSDWNVKVEDNSMNGIESKLYMFDAWIRWSCCICS